MRVLQLEMPRALTTSVKGFDFRNHALFEKAGVSSDHADLNTLFWEGCLQEHGLGLDRLAEQAVGPAEIAAIAAMMAAVGDSVGFPLGPRGFNFGEISSSRQIEPLAARSGFRSCAEALVRRADRELRLEEFDVISLNIDCNEALVWAAAVAGVLRTMPDGGRGRRIVLGKHGYENYSLRFRAEEISGNGHLHGIFDDVIFREEEFVESILALLGVGPQDLAPEPAAGGGSEVVLRSSRGLACLPMKPGNTVIVMPVTRNKCYWKKCTFCVQINKHRSDRYYEEASELACAVEEMSAYAALGYGHFIFTDEALSPRMLRRLCEAMIAADLRVSWYPRLIADTKFDSDLIVLMRKAGCDEVLFGLETVNATTARMMKKVSGNAAESDVFALINSFANEQICVLVNFIHAYPTESDGDFQQSFAFCEKLLAGVPGVTLILNKFCLFYGSEIFRRPGEHNIRSMEQPCRDEDLKLVFDYEDRFGRRGFSPSEPRLKLIETGCSPQQAHAIASVCGGAIAIASQLDYGSFGIFHRRVNNQRLMATIADACLAAAAGGCASPRLAKQFRELHEQGVPFTRLVVQLAIEQGYALPVAQKLVDAWLGSDAEDSAGVMRRLPAVQDECFKAASSTCRPAPRLRFQLDAPSIALLDGFATAEECEELVGHMLGRDERRYAWAFPGTEECRKDGVVLEQDLPLVAELGRRVELGFGWPAAFTEPFRVTCRRPADGAANPFAVTGRENGGERVGTLLICLQRPEAGGGIYFPKLDLSIGSEVGSALLIVNGDVAHAASADHCRRPLEAGEEWVLEVGFRERRIAR